MAGLNTSDLTEKLLKLKYRYRKWIYPLNTYIMKPKNTGIEFFYIVRAGIVRHTCTISSRTKH
jgi:hypothetical protein